MGLVSTTVCIVHEAIFVKIVEIFLIFELVFLEVTTTTCLQYLSRYLPES